MYIYIYAIIYSQRNFILLFWCHYLALLIFILRAKYFKAIEIKKRFCNGSTKAHNAIAISPDDLTEQAFVFYYFFFQTILSLFPQSILSRQFSTFLYLIHVIILSFQCFVRCAKKKNVQIVSVRETERNMCEMHIKKALWFMKICMKHK